MNRVSCLIAAFLLAVPLTAGPAFAAPAKNKVKTQSLVGTLQKVDGQTLTVQTSKGPETVTLASNATVHHGSKTMTASELASQTGSKVKVHYNVSNGQKEARSITVSSAPKVAHAQSSTKSASKASQK